MDPAKIIACLNSLNVGEMGLILGRLDEARQACLELERSELALKLDEAEQALGRCDMKTYRKRVETVVSQLGHLK